MRRRRSLHARLLAASLGVALCAIAGTAWLVTRATSREAQRQVDRVLEADVSIYQELLRYAQEHATWDGASAVVDELSARTHRRIALTTPDGSILVDSAREVDGRTSPLPDAPAAVVDALAPGLTLDPPAGAALGLDGLAPQPRDGPADASAQDLRLNRAYLAGVERCLSAAGVAYEVLGAEGELRAVHVTDPAQAAAHQRCADAARDDALARSTADPVLLYLGTGDRELEAGAIIRDWTTVVTLVAVVAVTIGATWAAGRRVLHPVRAMTSAARDMATGHTETRVTVRGSDEVAELARAFNTMADEVERTERARQAMVADVAHELRNPLTNIRTHLEAAQDSILELDQDLVASLLEEAGTLERLTGDLRDLALADAGALPLHLQEVDLRAVAEQVVAGALPRAQAAEVTLAAEGASAAEVRGDPVRLRQALGNLVDNALRYTPAGGAVRIVVRSGGHGASVAVVDTGTGIDAAHLPHLFDRFYRVDPSRTRSTGGSGLGLAIARHIARAHGGELGVTSSPGQGTTFTLDLPAGTGAGDRRRAAASRSAV